MPKMRGDELPAEPARRESRLRKIREAKAALEAEAREKAEEEAADARRRLAEREEIREGAGSEVRRPSPARPGPRDGHSPPESPEELHRSRLPYHGGRSHQILRPGLQRPCRRG